MTPLQMDLTIGRGSVTLAGRRGGLGMSRHGAGGGAMRRMAPQEFAPGRGDLTVARPHLPGPLRPGPFIASPVGGFRAFHPARRAPGRSFSPAPGASNRGVSPLIRRRTVSGFAVTANCDRTFGPSVPSVDSPAGDCRGLFGGGAVMPNPHPSRADDERLLLILALRKRGVPSAKVAEAAGVSRANIDNAVSRVRLADLAESGEQSDVVRRGYL
jgi:hypothetical protein